MRNKIIISTILLLFSIQGNSQDRFFNSIDNYTTIDSAYLLITYKHNFVVAENKDLISEDIQSLLIGKNISKFYSTGFLDYNIKIADGFKSGKYRNSYPARGCKDCCSYEIFKYYANDNTLKYNEYQPFILPTLHFSYDETLPTFDWTIGLEQNLINGYNCTKATTRFRGRDYTAWFTINIPINNGPWKFGGLPGLIMKISDNENLYVWECIGIKQLQEKEEIKSYNIKKDNVSRKDFNKLYIRFNKDRISFLSAFGLNYGGDRPEEFMDIPYNPIELE